MSQIYIERNFLFAATDAVPFAILCNAVGGHLENKME